MSFKSILKRMIKLEGPMRLDRFMSLVLEQYYANNIVFGGKGDFITSPEISNAFGYTICNWIEEIWHKNRNPKFQILELGPGRGTLIKDVLSKFKGLPIYKSIKNIILVERSTQLINQQKKVLQSYDDINIKWQNSIEDVGDYFTILLANEFFDALPIRQLAATEKGIVEIMVGMDTEGNLCFVKELANLNNQAVKDFLEFSPQAILYAKEISEILNKNQGAGLIIDYGYLDATGKSTLQAVKNHQHWHLLHDLGEADWTAHVNFPLLMECMVPKPNSFLILSQRDFLYRYGIKNYLSEEDEKFLRLTSPEQMGDLFKALSFEY